MELPPEGPPSLPPDAASAPKTQKGKRGRKASGEEFEVTDVTKKPRAFVTKDTLSKLQEATAKLRQTTQSTSETFAKEAARVQSSQSTAFGLTTHFLSKFCLSYIGIKSESLKAEENISSIIDSATRKFCEDKRSKNFINTLQVALENGVTADQLSRILTAHQASLQTLSESMIIEITQKVIEFQAAKNSQSPTLQQMAQLFSGASASFVPKTSDMILYLLQQKGADEKIVALLNRSSEELKVVESELVQMAKVLQQNPEYHPILPSLAQVVGYIQREQTRIDFSSRLTPVIQALDEQNPKELLAKLQEALEKGYSEAQITPTLNRKRKNFQSLVSQVETELKQKILQNRAQVAGAPSDALIGKLASVLLIDLNRLQTNITLTDRVLFWVSFGDKNVLLEAVSKASLDELLKLEAGLQELVAAGNGGVHEVLTFVKEQKSSRLLALVDDASRDFAIGSNFSEYLNVLQKALASGLPREDAKRIVGKYNVLLQPSLPQIKDRLKLAVLEAQTKGIFAQNRQMFGAMGELFGWTLDDISPKKGEVAYLKDKVERPILFQDIATIAQPLLAQFPSRGFDITPIAMILNSPVLQELSNPALQEIKNALTHCKETLGHANSFAVLLADLHWALGNKIQALTFYEQMKIQFPPGDSRLARLFPQPINTQLREIHQLSAKAPDVQVKLMNFCIDLVHQSLLHGLSGHYTSLPNSFLTARAEETLGMVLLLLDKDPASIQSINFETPQKARDGIEERFAVVLKQSLLKIDEIVADTNRLPLASKAAILEVAIPIEIAKLLITPAGELNHAIFAHVKAAHLGHKKERSSFEKFIAHSLKQYERLPETRAALSDIYRPDLSNKTGELMIRSTLDIAPGVPLTDRDARIAALAATLSHWRQGPIETCYVSAFVIQTTTNALIKALQDFKALFQVGYLEREVKGEMVRFFGVPNQEQRTLDVTIVLDPATQAVKKVGDTVITAEAFLHESPNMRAVCREIGIADVQGATQEAIKNEMREPGFVIPRKLIEFLVSQRFAKGTAEYEELLMRANFVYQSKRTQPVLRILENTIAGMQLAPNAGDISPKTQLETAIKEALLERVDKKQAKLVDLLVKAMPMGRIRYFFDPACPTAGKPKEAFVMFYQRDGAVFERIDNLEQFQKLLVELINESIGAKKAASPLLNLLKHPTIMKEVAESAMQKFSSMPRQEVELPWMLDPKGNIANIYQIYWHAQVLDKRIAAPKRETPVQSMMNVLAISQEYQALNIENKELAVPVISAHHAFSLLPLHPSIPRGISNDNDMRQWCSTYLSEGQKLGNANIDEETRNNLVYFATNEYIETEEEKTAFTAEVARIGQSVEGKMQKISLHDYIEELLKTVESVRKKPLTTVGKNNEIKKFDEYLYEWGLSRTCKRQLDSTLVRFADFNWVFVLDEKSPAAKGKRPTLEHGQLCFLVNPRTQELSAHLISPDCSRCMAGHDSDASFVLQKLDESILTAYKDYFSKAKAQRVELESAHTLAEFESRFLEKWHELQAFAEKIDEPALETAKAYLKEIQEREDSLLTTVGPAKKRTLVSKPRVQFMDLQLKQTDLLARVTDLLKRYKMQAPELALIQHELLNYLIVPRSVSSDAELAAWQSVANKYLEVQSQVVEKISLMLSLVDLRNEHAKAVQKVLAERGSEHLSLKPELNQVPVLAEASERDALGWLYGSSSPEG